MFGKKVKKVNKLKKEEKMVKENSNVNQEKKEKNRFCKHIKKNRKVYTIIFATLLTLLVVVSVIYFIKVFLINKEYSKYEEQMKVYGFDLLYDNKSPESSEKVTKLEAVKLVLGTVYNTNDATYIGYQPEGKYEGDEWVKTAEVFGILEKGKINKDNINENVSYWDFIKMYLNARDKKHNVNVSSKKESKFKDLNSYSQEQRKYINDLVENNLIKDKEKDINLNQDVIKGKVNEIVVNYVNQYSSLAEEGEKFVTKKESMPKNSELYPYIVYSIPNEVYEIKHVNENSIGYTSPKQLYSRMKEYYSQIEYRVSNYFSNILNIDYNNIDAQTFKSNIEDYLLYKYEDSVFDEYVNHVKANKIKLEGKATVLLPIVYYDDTYYRVRTKIEFKVINSDTNKNILFGDSMNNGETGVTYNDKEYELYLEVPVSRLVKVVSYRLPIVSIIDIISDKDNIKENTL